MKLHCLLRGGSWGCNPWICCSTYRHSSPPSLSGCDTGFRVVCPPPEQESETILHYILRGGCFFPEHCRSASRDPSLPGYAVRHIGFRVVCLPTEQK